MLVLSGCAASSLSPPRPVLYADDQPVPPPGSRSPSLAVEILDKTLAYPLKRRLDLPRLVRDLLHAPYEAQNVDAFDEVPNSSWFTNRLGRHRLTPAQVQSGVAAAGPDTTAPWTVISFKSTGVTPGMMIIDGRGDGYIIKIDPPDYVGLASGADVIGSRLLHAAGYNVPQNTVAWLDPERLRLDAAARLSITSADNRDPLDERPLTESELQQRLQAFMPQGQRRLRVIASRFLSGRLLGPFSYTGVRQDDANDVIAHEHRRELRGLYVVSAWMNHADMKAENSLDVYDPQVQHVVHYLLDFGAAMGSNSVAPSNPRRGVANSFDLGDAAERWASLGLRVHPYEGHPRSVVHPEVGYLDNDLFHPARWKPMYPAPPFDNLTDRDAFWGTRIVTAFTDDHIRAAVAAGQFETATADSALVRFLIERRDRIGHYWFDRVNPLDEFHLDESGVTFADLAVDRGYASELSTRYGVRILNDEGVALKEAVLDGRSVPLNDSLPARIIIDLWPEREGDRWRPVRLYLRRTDRRWDLVGLRRL